MIKIKDLDNVLKELELKAELLKAIAHPVRLCIISNLIKEGATNVTEMKNCLGKPQSTISQHLAKLRSAGIVEGRRNGVEVEYVVVNEDVKKIIEILI